MTNKPGRQSKISAKELIREFISGMNMRDIAGQYGLSSECIRLHLLSDGPRQYHIYKRQNRKVLGKQQFDKFMQFIQQAGRIPSLFECRQKGLKFSIRVFKTFCQLAEKAGYKYKRKRKSALYSNEELLNELKRLAHKFGHTPCVREIKSEGKYSHITYRQRFGSLCNAQEAAGLAPNVRGGSLQQAISNGFYVTKEDCMADLMRVVKLLGYFPSCPELNKYGKYSYDTYKKRLGGLKVIRRHLISKVA